MQLSRSGKARRFTRQPLDPGTQGQMLALDLLCVSLAWAVDSSVEMTRVGAPIIRIIACDPKGFQQSLQLQKYRIPPPTKDIGQDLSGVVIDGMPEPAGVAFVPDKRPDTVGESTSKF